MHVEMKDTLLIKIDYYANYLSKSTNFNVSRPQSL